MHPGAEYACPECDSSLELDGSDIDSEEGDIEVDCSECGASLQVSWSNWGEDAEAELLGESETSRSTGPKTHSRRERSQASAPGCPRCAADLSIPDESDLLECKNCGASIEVTLSSKGKVTDLEVEDIPDVGCSKVRRAALPHQTSVVLKLENVQQRQHVPPHLFARRHDFTTWLKDSRSADYDAAPGSGKPSLTTILLPFFWLNIMYSPGKSVANR